MRVLEGRWPARRVEQKPMGCLPASLAAALNVAHGLDADEADALLRRRVRPTKRGGRLLQDAAAVVRSTWGVPVEFSPCGIGMGEISRRAFLGPVVLGLDAGTLYGTGPFSPHAVLVVSGHHTAIPSGMPKQLAEQLWGHFTPPLSIVDPEPRVQASSRWMASRLEGAYRRANEGHLWLPVYHPT